MDTTSIIVSVFLVFVTVIIYMVHWTRKCQKFRRMGIPGPKAWPLVGNIPSLMKEGLYHYHYRLYKEYSNAKVYAVSESTRDILMVKDLDMIRDICIKNFNNFVNRRAFFDRDPFGNMLTMLKGDHWRRVRNAVSPTFSSGKLKRMFGHVEESARILSSNLKKACEEGKQVELKEICSCFTMDVIASTGFGVKVDSLNNKDNEFATQAKNIMDGFSNIALALVIAFPKLAMLLEKIGLELFPTKPAKYFSSFVDEAMSQRQKGVIKRHDFLQLVVDAEETSVENKTKSLSHADIQGTGLIFILAGYDTVSSAMSFTLFQLAHDPECMEKLQMELDRVLEGRFPTYENVAELTYLDMCINEAMRLYPPGFVIDRECTEECDIGGIHIPKNCYVSIPIIGIHHDPKLWPEPEKFDPERFTAANKEGRHPFAHLPFGQGPRNCIGMRLALLEMKVAIAAILQEMSPVPCEESVYPPKIHKNVFKATDGLWVKLKPRSN